MARSGRPVSTAGPIDYDAMDANALVALVKARDHRAFETLYRRYRAYIAAIFWRKVRDPDAVDDLVADVFAKLWSHTPEPDNIEGWLSYCAGNRATDYVRLARHKREVLVGFINGNLITGDRDADPRQPGGWNKAWNGEMLAPESDRAEEKALRDEERAYMTKLLASLDPKYAQACYLRDVEMLSYAEVAERMGISTSSARNYIFRGRSWMARTIANDREGWYPLAEEYPNRVRQSTNRTWVAERSTRTRRLPKRTHSLAVRSRPVYGGRAQTAA